MNEAAGRVILGLDPGTASTGYGVVSVSGNRFRAAGIRGGLDDACRIALEQQVGDALRAVERRILRSITLTRQRWSRCSSTPT